MSANEGGKARAIWVIASRLAMVLVPLLLGAAAMAVLVDSGNVQLPFRGFRSGSPPPVQNIVVSPRGIGPPAHHRSGAHATSLKPAAFARPATGSSGSIVPLPSAGAPQRSSGGGNTGPTHTPPSSGGSGTGEPVVVPPTTTPVVTPPPPPPPPPPPSPPPPPPTTVVTPPTRTTRTPPPQSNVDGAQYTPSHRRPSFAPGNCGGGNSSNAGLATAQAFGADAASTHPSHSYSGDGGDGQSSPSYNGSNGPSAPPGHSYSGSGSSPGNSPQGYAGNGNGNSQSGNAAGGGDDGSHGRGRGG